MVNWGVTCPRVTFSKAQIRLNHSLAHKPSWFLLPTGQSPSALAGCAILQFHVTGLLTLH